MKRWFRAGVVLFALFGVTRCYSETDGSLGGPNDDGTGGRQEMASVDGSVAGTGGTASGAGGSDAGSTPTKLTCAPARTGESLPARTAVMGAPEVTRKTMLTGDLFNEFKSKCGACHVSIISGNFAVAQNKFIADISRDVDGKDIGRLAIDRIFDEEAWMPPPPTVPDAPSKRDAKTDQYLVFGKLLTAWFDQGKPADVFTPPADDTPAPPAEQTYLLTESVGKSLTNLGNCIPNLVANSNDGDALDQKFTGTSLPPTLAETDLTTLDSLELAKHGVIAYAPAYPLWSDNAHKIRHVRVPRGQSIRFDRATQTFDIPENTRFYKTFTRQVIEKDGGQRYRKMETRLIVARKPQMENGVLVQKALFGSYEWDDGEASATLSHEKRRDGTLFADHILPFTTDEKKYTDIVAAHQPGKDLQAELQAGGAIRHYAVPGSERCVQCHMGSPTNDFVLGFLPLQIKWRPKGEGGVIEETGDDELNQLQRMIDYGVITGVDSVDDILPLEESQGDRKPRSDEELVAQGYLLGNCAHCHNPHGYPTTRNPELNGVLDFLPRNEANAGVFQFPLDRFSPRIGRGAGGITKIPYITPSLVDYPSKVDRNWTCDHRKSPCPEESFIPSYMVPAPWRSLIYRNVDTPFPYSVDVALFPHMPMNVPGFDCRAPRIMGDWMVSVPAVRKTSLEETIVQACSPDPNTLLFDTDTGDGPADPEEQPYVEVKPEDRGYKEAKVAASARLEAYRTGVDPTNSVLKPNIQTATAPKFYSRYQYCVDSPDIFDPTVTGDKTHLVPADILRVRGLKDGKEYRVPTSYDPVPGPTTAGQYTEDKIKVPAEADTEIIWPDEGVPDRTHWVTVESGEPPGDYTPRRADAWERILVKHEDPNSATKTAAGKAEERLALEVLEDAKLTDAVKQFTGAKVPFGLWMNKPECATKFKTAGVKKVSEFADPPGSNTHDRPLWMGVNPSATPDAPVYSELPGAAVFNMVCQNCHGPQADAQGRQADTLQAMTGGDARVANLRDGLFGPPGSPGGNRLEVFDKGNGLTADDWAAKYLAWMALGGTEKLIPKAILNVVSVTPVLGQVRRFQGADSANMLGPVQFLCGALFTLQNASLNSGGLTVLDTEAGTEDKNPIYQSYGDAPPRAPDWGQYVWEDMVDNIVLKEVFLPTIGDPELWARLCAVDNPMPIRIVNLHPDERRNTMTFVDARNFPASTPVGTHLGTVADALDASSNILPWCVINLEAQDLERRSVDGKPLPVCPDSILTKRMLFRDIQRWTFRGAVNAGFSVFEYLDQVAHGLKPVPAYDHCEQLP